MTLKYWDGYFDEKQYCTAAELDLVTGIVDANVLECIIN